MKLQEDRSRAAAREKRFSTLAQEEAQGAAQRARREETAHMPVSAADSRREARVDTAWAKKRKVLAKKLERSKG